jgi:hypothetical protein
LSVNTDIKDKLVVCVLRVRISGVRIQFDCFVRLFNTVKQQSLCAVKPQNVATLHRAQFVPVWGGSKSQYGELLFTDLCVPYERMALYWSLYLFKEVNIFIRDFYINVINFYCMTHKMVFISVVFGRVNHTFDSIDCMLRFIYNIVLLCTTFNS